MPQEKLSQYERDFDSSKPSVETERQQQQCTVLIVDDCPEDRETYRRYLLHNRESCYTILAAELGKEGLELCVCLKPDVVLLDYLLPDIDGLEFLAQLQSRVMEKHPAVIILTGQGDEVLAVQFLQAGAENYLVKGRTTADQLHLALNSAMAKTQLRGKLQQSEERLKLALESAQIGIWEWNISNNSLVWSDLVGPIFGFPIGYCLPTYEALINVVYPKDRELITQVMADAIQSGTEHDVEFRIIWCDGSMHWINSKGKVHDDRFGQPVKMLGTVMEITQSKQAELARLEQIQREQLVMRIAQYIRKSLKLDEILNTTVREVRQFLQSDRVLIFRFQPDWQGTVVVESVSPDYKSILSTTIYDPCFTQTKIEPYRNGRIFAVEDIHTAGLIQCHVDLLAQFQVRANLVVPILQEENLWGLLITHHCSASRQWEQMEIDLLKQLADQVGIAIQQSALFEQVQIELLERQQAEAQMSWQARHDALTGLVNRREFENNLEQAINNAKTHNQQHALCYLDLDQFKIVNDTCGHFAGDELLRQVTALFQSQVRKTDTLSRLGGDEFGLLLDQCPLAQAQRIANSLREKVQEFRFVWQEKLFTIGVSIGLVIIDTYTQSVAQALSLADVACYAAKNRGRNRVHVYQIDDLDLAKQQGEMQWVTRLAHALEENRFRLYCQPIVPVFQTELKTEQHFEILLRLQDETGNLVLPMAFIPAAERYNLMHLIDRWVIRTLFATLGLLSSKTKNHSQDLYAINLSGASINDDQFTEFLHNQFALHQIPPRMICFEITETVTIGNLSKASQFISELRSLGCRFALDDFGSGMSSFAYLKNLPVDFLKIDGSFIKQILNNPIDSAIVEAINHVGQIMGIQTIAEFVENDAVLEKIKALGVNYAQGYGIAKPCPLERIIRNS
ncbi:MAG: EAL domain-containing protein [Stigonema ocellatum SAG 48.90 = DSM 106950]|nr:EAL domain-containing protein [Stigonema ocellatum SAG 48.90 = DSM 106950]